ncbi:methyltransferase [Fusarium coicis]|nr:methyltransferase [Fusarium coicis]
MNHHDIYTQVGERYGSAAEWSNATYSTNVAKAFGYSDKDLDSIPKDANLGLSCGTPLAIASLKEGETVIDLGCGAGLDIFLSSSKVGATGKAIGVDMNKATRKLKADRSMGNVELIESRITDIALEDNIADCIISSCVINLVPHDEKQKAFNEMHRLLKPGGRVAISDILAKKPLSDDIRNSMALYVGCIAGASQVEEYEEYLKRAGFNDILITDTNSDLNVYLDASTDTAARGCCSVPDNMDSMANDLKGQSLNEWAGM